MYLHTKRRTNRLLLSRLATLKRGEINGTETDRYSYLEHAENAEARLDRQPEHREQSKVSCCKCIRSVSDVASATRHTELCLPKNPWLRFFGSPVE